MNNLRIPWSDNVKDAGIFLVVFAHHEICVLVKGFIYAFHMSLFFFVSRYLFSAQKHVRFKKFVYKRLKTLIIPCLFFAAVAYCCWLFAVRPLFLKGRALLISPVDALLGVFHSNWGVGLGVPMATALWFCTCLFVTESLFWLLKKSCGQDSPKLVGELFIAGTLGYASSLWFFPLPLPWGINIAWTAVVFYGAGFLFKEKLSLSLQISGWKKTAATLIAFLAGLFYYFNGMSLMYPNSHHNPLLFYGAAFFSVGWSI